MWFGLQDDINSKMRVILTDWLVEVHLKFRLRNETLFLCFQARSSHTTHRIPQSISCCANLLEQLIFQGKFRLGVSCFGWMQYDCELAPTDTTSHFSFFSPCSSTAAHGPISARQRCRA